MAEQKVTLILFDTYIAMIKNSVGSNIFRNLYAKVENKKIDITRDGDLSCAIFVSSVLYLFKLIGNIHATVNGTVQDLENFGWKEIKEPKIGSVLIWSEKVFESGEKHKHIGFYVGENKAISNNSELRQPIEHNWQINDERKIEKILWNYKLEEIY